MVKQHNAFSHMSGYIVFAVPQKKWQEEMTQFLATADKTTIVHHIAKIYTASLSSLQKKI